MSDNHSAQVHGADHTPHVTPYKVYFATWGALVVLTAITVAASYVNFGPANLIIAIVIATIKAAVVAALFMHLWHDNKMHALILASGGIFLIIFVSFTMFDTEYRGKADAIEGERPADITRPFEGTKSLAAMKAKWPSTAISAAPAAPAAPAASGSEHAAAAPSASAPEAPASATPSTSASAPEAASASASAATSASAPPAASGSAAPTPSAH